MWYCNIFSAEILQNFEATVKLPGNDSFRGGLIFCWHSFFIFLLQDPKAPSADRHEILHGARKSVRFYNSSPKSWGALPQKKLGTKNMQNLVQFQTSSNLTYLKIILWHCLWTEISRPTSRLYHALVIVSATRYETKTSEIVKLSYHFI